MSSESTSSPWPRRVFKTLAWAAGAFIGWMLVLNLALWTGFVSWAVSGHHRMSSIQMSHGFAWVVWPTRVHVQSFSLTIDAYRYQLDLDIPEGSIDIELLGLISREVNASTVRGEGATAVFRYKAPPGKVSDERRALHGPIDGLSEPVRHMGAPDLPPLEKAWSVNLAHIDGQFSDIWVNELHFHDADVHIQGGLRTRSGDMFAVDGAHIDVETASLSIDEKSVATDWTGTVDLDVADYDPFSLQGKDVIGQITGDVLLDAQVVDLAPAAVFVSRPLKLRNGAGPLHLGLVLREGVVQPETDIDYRTSGVGVSVAKWSGKGRVHASLRGRAAGRPALRAGLDLRGVELDRSKNDADPIAIKHLSAYAVSRNTDLTESLKLDDAHALVDGIDVPNLAILADDIDGPKPKKGTVRGRYEVDLRGNGRLAHDLDLEVRGAKIADGKLGVDVAADLHASASTSQRLDEGETTKFDLDIHDLGVDSAKGHSQRTWVKLHDDSKLRWKPNGSISGTIRGRLDDLKIILAHASERKSIVERVPDLEVTEPFDFVVDVQRTKKTTTIEIEKMDRPGLRIEGIRRSRGKASRSAFRLERLRTGFTTREDGAHAVFVGADEAWMKRQADWVREL